jgi:two-component system, NtrC family, response regulator AtoC
MMMTGNGFAKITSIPQVDGLPPEHLIFGRTGAMLEVRQKVARVADTNVPALIRGESGTGKEVIAKLIHSQSPWKSGPFVKIHCPSIPGTLLESELFGYEEGAFTGAFHPKPGRVEAAQGGTLFLDEIAEMDSSLQAKLLNLLQDGQIFRIGASKEKRVEIRVLCATNRALEREIESGNFCQDLFYRINVVSLQLAPLRERREDIPDLVDHFLQICNLKYNRQTPTLSERCKQLLIEAEWPGNIRELENLINRYVILASEDAIVAEVLSRPRTSFAPDSTPRAVVPLRKIARQAAREAERKVLLRVLQAHQWNRKQAARALNISYRGLLYKIKEAGIPPKRVLDTSRGRLAPSAN